ncbi:hypothetical protein G4G27_02790 [Sphingomonas sp. So64.6b]|uniref:hypothetical protein n=1 Tax=Sphingomonas sp. So64.6b TaxID=2997354 RepID=UPI0016004D74|nr:hypothetical protein [Sphingomonas sp. So64.6b]QNA83058.1 hypothetical protein G4G27_02790 [Sphingomonas sp. So64.6b]
MLLRSIVTLCGTVGPDDCCPAEMKAISIFLTCAALSGCDTLPRDPDSTLDRIRGGQVIRVGVALPDDTGLAGPAAALLARVGEETGAKPQIARGSLEPLLVNLEQGRLDIVIAAFAHDTPWATRVALAPPLAIQGENADRLELRAAMPNGENRWVMLVEKATRAVAPEAARS